MSPYSSNRLIFWARLTQIACGILVFSFSLAATASAAEGDGLNDYDLQFAASFLGAGIALFGAFGLFGCRKRTDEPEEVRLSMLILFIDCWALLLCFGAGIILSIQSTNWSSYYMGPNVLIYIPAIFSFLCGGIIVLPLIIRTARLWGKALLVRIPQHITPGKDIDLESHHAHTCCHQHQHQDPELAYTVPHEARRSHQTDGVKSTFSSRPHSVISGADTLTYPNIGNIAQSGAPTRAPSHTAPSYTSRVEVGSKVAQS